MKTLELEFSAHFAAFMLDTYGNSCLGYSSKEIAPAPLIFREVDEIASSSAIDKACHGSSLETESLQEVK